MTPAWHHAGIRPRSPSTTLSRAFSSDMLCRSPTTSPLLGSPTHQQRYQDAALSPGEEAYTSMPSFSWQLPPVHPSTSAAGTPPVSPSTSAPGMSNPGLSPHLLCPGSTWGARLSDWPGLQMLQLCRAPHQSSGVAQRCPRRHTGSHAVALREWGPTPPRLHIVTHAAGSSSAPMMTASSAPLAFYPAASGSLHPSIQPVVSLQHLNGHSHPEHGMMSNASSASIRDR